MWQLELNHLLLFPLTKDQDDHFLDPVFFTVDTIASIDYIEKHKNYLKKFYKNPFLHRVPGYLRKIEVKLPAVTTIELYKIDAIYINHFSFESEVDDQGNILIYWNIYNTEKVF